jgi:hypothetical protein
MTKKLQKTRNHRGPKWDLRADNVVDKFPQDVKDFLRSGVLANRRWYIKQAIKVALKQAYKDGKASEAVNQIEAVLEKE